MAHGNAKLDGLKIYNVPSGPQDAVNKAYADGLTPTNGVLTAFIPFSGSEYTVTASSVGIPGLSISGLVASKIYKVEMDIFVRSVASGFNITLDWAGGTATATHAQWGVDGFYIGNYGLGTNPQHGLAEVSLDFFGSTLGAGVSFPTGAGPGGAILVKFRGILSVNVGGTFQPRIATDNVASGAVVCLGSMMELTPLN